MKKIWFSSLIMLVFMFNLAFGSVFQETYDRETLKKFVHVIKDTENEKREILDIEAAIKWFKDILPEKVPAKSHLNPLVECKPSSDATEETVSGSTKTRAVTLIKSALFTATFPEEQKNGDKPVPSEKTQILGTVLRGVIEIGRLYLDWRKG